MPPPQQRCALPLLLAPRQRRSEPLHVQAPLKVLSEILHHHRLARATEERVTVAIVELDHQADAAVALCGESPSTLRMLRLPIASPTSFLHTGPPSPYQRGACAESHSKLTPPSFPSTTSTSTQTTFASHLSEPPPRL
jgi:hypothetical protein